MVIHYPPARLRSNSDQPTAISNVLVATSESSSRTGDIPLGAPTCSARTRRGRWALYPSGEEVVVVWPGGALTGPPAEVAGELDRLGGDRALAMVRRLSEERVRELAEDIWTASIDRVVPARPSPDARPRRGSRSPPRHERSWPRRVSICPASRPRPRRHSSTSP
jgi:hypothetical protein